MLHNYIIHIYRNEPRQGPSRRAHDAIVPIGSVEAVESGELKIFRDCDELWAFIVGGTRKENTNTEGELP